MLYLHLAPSKRFSYGSQRLRFWREDNLDLDQDQLNFLGKASQLFFYSRRKQKVVKEIKKRKFLVRDWSIWLGWNNQRYIIESALLLAKKLDRELVLPAFHYANSCEEDKSVCDQLLPFLVANVTVDLRNVSDPHLYPDPDNGTTVLKPRVPDHHNRGWIMPLKASFHMSENTIKFEDFLKLTPYKNKKSIGMSTGQWSELYNEGMSYRKIPNSFFEGHGREFVDRIPQPIKPLIPTSKSESPDVPKKLIEKCEKALGKLKGLVHHSTIMKRDSFPSWNDESVNGKYLVDELSTDHSIFERCIASIGMRSVYGFTELSFWMKAPYDESKHVQSVSQMIGVLDTLEKYDEQVLHIEGEIHISPPGSMKWTNMEGREEYKRLVRTAIRPPEIYHRVAARLELKMRARCNGRSWIASQMRRGDFMAYTWAADTINDHWTTIEWGISRGLGLLESEPKLLKPIQDVFHTSLELPKVGDPFYLATNIRSSEDLKFLRSKNIVLLQDLLDESDKRLLGKLSASFMDTLAILEQCLIIRSAYYYGDAHSSISGLILNQRVSNGIDERLTRLEYMFGRM
ncbi:hypothetical protein PPACK8108_LOCUS26282 [Phakopsora pachyrhizi]|uniref:Uncharacterized protein n=1 Tax=Phakopsora pachyrhizi TaxID=170000 RepID=A0AAV0BWD4_PHAPC|nr:hypothetical protein PPACK8108_LOCUS26282 [Phakopsora pachyrhizi]